MYTIYVLIIVLEILLAVVELQQLPLLLLLLKLYIHKSCAGAATAVVGVRHRVQDDAIYCCVFFAVDFSVSFLYLNMIYLNVPLGSAVACTASISL